MNNPGFKEVTNWGLEDLGERRNPPEKKLRLSTWARRDEDDHNSGIPQERVHCDSRASQQCESHKCLGFPVHRKVMFTPYCNLVSEQYYDAYKNNVYTFI